MDLFHTIDKPNTGCRFYGYTVAELTISISLPAEITKAAAMQGRSYQVVQPQHSQSLNIIIILSHQHGQFKK